MASPFENMLTYSSQRFSEDWRHSVEKEFIASDGQRYPYAEDGGHVERGQELSRIQFTDKEPGVVAFSDDSRFLAVAVEHDIHVISTETFAVDQILRGHESKVDGLVFQPGNSNTLVSSAENDSGGLVSVRPTVILWNVQEQKSMEDICNNQNLLKKLSTAAAQGVSSSLASRDELISLTPYESIAMSGAFYPSIYRILSQRNVTNTHRLHGRLVTSCQSKVFSPSGEWMLYLPKDHPQSNDRDERWVINVYSMDKYCDEAVLAGHTDAVMWTGFNPDEALVGTVAWDNTIRIWDWKNRVADSLCAQAAESDAATAGEPAKLKHKYKFETQGQNWTGSFSRDGQYFAGTCGDGHVFVYDLSDGSTAFVYQDGHQWCRALDWSQTLVGKNQHVSKALQHRSSSNDNAPNRDLLCVGTSKAGQLLLLDINAYGDGSAEVYDLVNECK